jgi:hypothetical protein
MCINQNPCRDVAVLRLYIVFRRCLMTYIHIFARTYLAGFEVMRGLENKGIF